MNYQFDLEEWMVKCPLAESDGRYEGKNITGPRDLCNNEWLRRELADAYDWGEAVPADLFVMAKGEPANRFATKLGGLPYRPASAPWPTAESGNPLHFLGQLNFSDSTDIAGKQPGDLLLVFAHNDDGWFEEFHFEWRTITDDSGDLVAELPKFVNPIDPCFGYRCRIMNYPNAVARNQEGRYPICRGKEVWSDYWLLQYQGTQIGRAAFEPQGKNPLAHLCTIASVYPDLYEPYSWVNVPHPQLSRDVSLYQRIQETLFPEGGHLMIGDLGCIFIVSDGNGQLSVDQHSF